MSMVRPESIGRSLIPTVSANMNDPQHFRAIGGRAYQFPNIETARKVHVGYVVPAATAFMTALAPKLPAGQKFRFVFCSGAFAEQKQDKSLLFMGDTRRVKVGAFLLIITGDVCY